METILDTNFILACVEHKADISEIDGIIIVPLEVIKELDRIALSSNRDKKEQAKVALKIIESAKDRIKIIELGNSYVDKGIEDYVTNSKDIVVGSLDKKLLGKLKGKVKFLSLEARKKFRVVW